MISFAQRSQSGHVSRSVEVVFSVRQSFRVVMLWRRALVEVAVMEEGKGSRHASIHVVQGYNKTDFSNVEGKSEKLKERPKQFFAR